MRDQPGDLRPRLQHAFEFAQRQVRRLVESHPDHLPAYTQGGKWVHAGEAWTHWCEGFLPGMMWIFHLRTGSDEWRAQAERYSRLLEPRKTDRTIHDLGFLFWPTWKRWYDLTGDEDVHQVVLTAGRTMGARFMPNGKYLRSFMAEDSVFIDIMMNVGIVFYAAEQLGDRELMQAAHQHCRTTRRYLVRGDGSTAHEGIFDTQTGAFLRQSTQQGWRGDSTWARGLAWSLYGFGTAYSMTGEPGYLATARSCADFYLENTPFERDAPGGPGVPPNDYDDPSQSERYESSAAAIAAGGLLNLSRIVQDPVHAQRYLQAARTILNTLTGSRYLAGETSGWEGVLKRAVYHLPKGLGVDESVMWGDYFFVEALDKALSMEGEDG